MRIMKNEVFNFGNHEVRVVIAENNEPMFVAKDVCNVLGYTKSTSQVIETHCKIEGCTKTVLPSNGGNQEMILINEGNLYRLILKSKKEEAEKFESWVCDEVLPSIRKHGMYANKQTLEEMLTSPEFAIKTLEALKTERAEKERLKYQNELQEAELMKAVPKVQYFEQVLQSNSTYNTNQIAKELGMSAIGLNNELNNLGIQYKQAGTWLLYAKYQDKGYTKTKTHSFTDNHGNQQTSMSTVWTEKGRLFIHDNLRIPKAG